MGEVVAIVHAKGTSRRVKNKNLRTLGGVPLFVHAIRNARQSDAVDCVVIDSDSSEIREIGSRFGAEPLERPAELATNEATGDDLAYWQASNYQKSEFVVQVVPTSPFTRPQTISEAVKMARAEEVDSVVALYSEPLYRWVGGRPSYFAEHGRIPNSFEMAPIVWETTGLYVIRTEFALSARRRLNPANCSGICVSRIEAIDIHTAEDFEFAEIVLAGLKK